MAHGEQAHPKFGDPGDVALRFQTGAQLADAIRGVPGVTVTDAPDDKVNVSNKVGNVRIHGGQQPLSYTEKRHDIGNLDVIGIVVTVVVVLTLMVALIAASSGI